MDWSNFLSSLIGTGIGGFITWLVSKQYYERASKDLKNESQGLRKLIILILEGLEIGGLVEIARDGKGNILGYNFLSARLSKTAITSDKPIVQIQTEKPRG